MRIVTPSQMKDIERISDENGVSYLQLMLNAGTGLGKFMEKRCKKEKLRKIVFLAGAGNNGGDCFVAAQYLNGAPVKYSITVALVCGEPKTETARSAFERMDRSRIRVTDDDEEIKSALNDADMIADGIFGTGFHGELDGRIAELLNTGGRAVRVAVDIPSGGDARTGLADRGSFRADYTVTFGFNKFGLTQEPLKSTCGEISVCGIGTPDICTEGLTPEISEINEETVKALLPERVPGSHKGTYGTLVCVTGSRNMPGAAVLSGRAALRSGIGLLKQCAVPESISAFAAAFPEPVYVPVKTDDKGFYTSENADMIISLTEKAGAVLIGCGLGCTAETSGLVKSLILNSKCPVVLDADGLNCIADCPEILNEASVPVIITPHPAEAGRLLGISAGEVQADRFKAVQNLNEKFPKVTAVLKGAGTIVSAGGKMFINPTGNPGMSTGGSGDVLAGITAALLAQNGNDESAAVSAVWIHGRAGDIAAERLSQYSMLPSDIVSVMGEVFISLSRQ